MGGRTARAAGAGVARVSRVPCLGGVRTSSVCVPASRMFAFSTDNVWRGGFSPGGLSVNMANDRKLLVGGESLHERLATGHHP